MGHFHGLEAQVLESIVEGRSRDEVLDQLCTLVGELREDTVCTIMELDEVAGTLDVSNAPCVPPDISGQLMGLIPGPFAGSCGTAVYDRAPVYVEDTQVDPRWESMREFAKEAGIVSCWSIPVWASKEKIVGSFAISHFKATTPSEEDKELLNIASRLAGITIRRNREQAAQEAAQIQMLQAQKLESMGVLAGGIAHDFNNLLFSMVANTQMLKEDLGEESPETELLDEILVGGERLRDICRSLMLYARGAPVKKEPLNLDTVCQELSNLLILTVKTKGRLELEPSSQLEAVEGDPGQIGQVVMNLITNASDALPKEGGIIHSRTGSVCLTRRQLDDLILGLHCTPGTYSFLEVRDNGHGMDAETAARIFDPFFTTKGTGRGLGLASLLGIVREHHGCLRVISAIGEGTTIRLYLPALEEPAQTKRTREAPTNQGHGTLLIVEDEPHVLKVTKRLAERSGFKVLSATSGREALDMVEEKRPDLEAAVIDSCMEGLDGFTTIQRFRKVYPEVPTVLVSGQFPPENMGEEQVFLAKPFSKEELLAALAQAKERLRQLSRV